MKPELTNPAHPPNQCAHVPNSVLKPGPRTGYSNRIPKDLLNMVGNVSSYGQRSGTSGRSASVSSIPYDPLSQGSEPPSARSTQVPLSSEGSGSAVLLSQPQSNRKT